MNAPLNAPLNGALRAELLALAGDDARVRAELVAEGTLFEGYHPRMAAVHRQNAARLRAILDELGGWPGPALVGADGAAAAFTVLQHAIGDPPLQRHGLALIRAAAAAGEVPARQVAMLEDRIRTFEGRPQRYGSQFDWDERGELSPLPIEDPDRVDERRRSAGLEPLADATRRLREAATREGERPPADPAERRRGMEAWAREVGWRP